ncbi:MAG: hypothetical protein IJI84_06085 [Clostridia bacterium]|nr:hypothetical protein [Clostridia bacterium]
MKTQEQMYDEALNTFLKDWCLKTYRTDELGEELNSRATFYDLFEALDNYQDIYNLFGINESIIRERIFEKLSEIMVCPYEEIYNQWLR